MLSARRGLGRTFRSPLQVAVASLIPPCPQFQRRRLASDVKNSTSNSNNSSTKNNNSNGPTSTDAKSSGKRPRDRVGAWEERIVSALVVNRPGTLAQLADVFAYADQNISSLCVRPTVVPELARVTISCALRDADLPGLKKRLRALVAVTFFHVTTLRFCVENRQLLLRSQLLAQVARPETAARRRELRELLESFNVDMVDTSHAPQFLPLLLSSSRSASKDKDEDATDSDKDAKGSTKAQIVHLADDPAKLDAFVKALKAARFRVIELQRCAPLFLDTSHSTYDPQNPSAATFTRPVDADVQRMLLTPVDDAELGTNPAIMREMNKRANPAAPQPESDPVDADLMSQIPPSSTFQLHSNAQGYFTNERLHLHARIAHQLYDSAPQGLTFPRFVLLIGIPGAGKSTILSHLDMVGTLTLADFVNFDVDDIIALLPEYYHAVLNVGLGNEKHYHYSRDDPPELLPGPQTRYQLCRDEARFILKKNLHSAIMCRKNIILHGSGKSFASYAHVIDQVKAAGFDTHVMCVDVPVSDAYARVEKRSNNGYGRDVPHSIIDVASALVTRNFRRLASRVPNAHLFDSTVIPPRLVWSKQRSEVVESDPDDPLQRKFEL